MSRTRHKVTRNEVTQPSDQSYRFIALTQNQIAVVDAEDFERVSQFNWYAQYDPTRHGFYAARWSQGKQIGMHAFITGHRMTDHRDGDGLNNRRSNLRACDSSTNNRNRGKHCASSSRYKGVTWHKRIKKWNANIRFNRKLIHLGYFTKEEEAATAYREAAVRLFGEFARF